MYTGAQTFSEFCGNLSRDRAQKDGLAGPVCQTGEQYREFYASGIARPPDIELVKRNVIKTLEIQLSEYCGRNTGTIYWRVKPEEWQGESPQVIKYDDGGPDIDFMTNQKCWKDNNWIGYKLYCRFVRTDKPELVKGAA